MRVPKLIPLYSALTVLAPPLDWRPLLNTVKLPYVERHAYSWFHKDLDHDPEHSQKKS